MPRRIGNTIVPRNHVARAATTRRGGVHERGRTAERQQNRAQIREMTVDWRDDVEFEQEVKVESDTSDA